MNNNKLIEFWKELNLASKPYIHPRDTALSIKLCHSFSDLKDYYETRYWNDNGIFHTDLMPIPYIGNIQSAKIFLLTKNPGFSLSDYYSEHSSVAFEAEQKRNLLQNHSDSEFPFLFLNPNFLWHAGAEYWLNKLKDYIIYVKEQRKVTYLEATSIVSKNVAVLELVPYHSVNFSQNHLLKKLNSVGQMKSFVNEYVIPKVYDNKACIVCARNTKDWDLPFHKNILIYQGGETRGAHISKNTRAYPLITKFLCK